MIHRPLLKTIVLMAYLSGLTLSLSAATDPKKPNIVLLLADDMTWSDCQPYGSPNVKTPNMKKLANQGMRFDNMHTATAMCAPTRQQLYTGLFPIRNGAFPNHSTVRKGVKSVVHHLSDLGYGVSLIGKTHFGPKESFPFKKASLDDVLKSKERPFCHILASTDPHLPWSRGNPKDYDPNKLIVPPNLIDTPQTRQSLCQYYAEISNLDKTLGSIMAALEKAGEADNTILIFTSEQGMTLPFGGKWHCYDTGLKTAFIVRWPGVVKPGSTTQALTQYVDFVPTLVEIAGGKPEQIDTGCKDANGKTGFDGRSFLPVLKGESDALWDVVYGVQTTRGIHNGLLYPVRSVRGNRYKYIRNINHKEPFMCAYTEGGKYYDKFAMPLIIAAKENPSLQPRLDHIQHRPYEELYDLQADPYELINLAADEKLASIKNKLSARLDVWMLQQGDKGIETEAAVPLRKKKEKKK